MLTWRGSYLVPKPDGAVVAGSTEEDSGFDARHVQFCSVDDFDPRRQRGDLVAWKCALHRI